VCVPMFLRISFLLLKVQNIPRWRDAQMVSFLPSCPCTYGELCLKQHNSCSQAQASWRGCCLSPHTQTEHTWGKQIFLTMQYSTLLLTYNFSSQNVHVGQFLPTLKTNNL
jgi:hypothetical protein